MAARQFNPEEAREILRRAVEKERFGEDGYLEQDLVRAAEELRVSASSVESAIVELDRERDIVQEVHVLKRERRQSFVSALFTFIVVGSGLYAVDALTEGGPWFHIPLLCWGLILLLIYKRLFIAVPAKERELAQKRINKRARLVERDRERQRRKLLATQFQETLEEGARAVVHAVKHKLEEAGIPTGPGSTERSSSEPSASSSSQTHSSEQRTSAKSGSNGQAQRKD